MVETVFGIKAADTLDLQEQSKSWRLQWSGGRPAPTSRSFKVYAPTHLLRWSPGTPFAWLDDAEAREILKATSSAYIPGLSSKSTPRMILAHLEEILTQLDHLHAEKRDGARDDPWNN
ncbi:hypothetical protein B0H13DRAFT_2382897 [Mycena leptocephala]|nr:hypothetical protein B0H13DRAFT_2382897 [Mycena leptocephala]